MALPKTWILLKRRRIAAGHTRLSLAKKVGWSVAQISRVEAGLCGPSPKLFAALAAELDVDLDELIASAPKPRPHVPGVSAVAS